MLDSSMKAFCEIYKFRSLVKEATCFKNPENLSRIDLILKNKHLRFRPLCAIEIELSDHSISLGTDSPGQPQPSNFFCPLRD